MKEKKEKQTKKTQPQNQDAKAPKWGTEEWIMAYPWSKMDKNRRFRVRKVLIDEDDSLFETDGGAVEYIDYLCEILAKANVKVPKRFVDKTKIAAVQVDNFMTCMRDELIAQLLRKHWYDKKPCAGCCSDKKPCKKTCKKSAKAKK